MYQRPKSDSPQERVTGDANHPAHYVGSLRKLRFHARNRWTRRRNPDDNEEEGDEYKDVCSGAKPKQEPPEWHGRCTPVRIDHPRDSEQRSERERPAIRACSKTRYQSVS